MNYTNRSLPGETNNKIYVEFKIIIASFLLSLVVLFFVARPIYMEMKINKDWVELIKKNTDLKNEALVSLEDFENKNININSRELMKVKSLLSDEDKSELYIANINKISKLPDSNMEIISLSIGEAINNPPNQGSGLKKVTIDLLLAGKYDRLIIFLNRAEKIIPLMNIESLSIEKNDSENYEVIDNLNKEIDVTADIALSFYYQ
ncbi:MAG: hypothetical protein KAS01_00220 [Candidatus Pacebacteria bacterium]|nr:hypothetical protein [Candidatus Paceibacterota bacterium]